MAAECQMSVEEGIRYGKLCCRHKWHTRLSLQNQAVKSALHRVASTQLWSFILFLIGSSGYQLGSTVAAVSAEHVKNTLQKITTEWTPHSVEKLGIGMHIYSAEFAVRSSHWHIKCFTLNWNQGMLSYGMFGFSSLFIRHIWSFLLIIFLHGYSQLGPWLLEDCPPETGSLPEVIVTLVTCLEDGDGVTFSIMCWK